MDDIGVACPELIVADDDSVVAERFERLQVYARVARSPRVAE
jgi:hypothetical protein